MRAGSCTVQQSLTTEASSVLKKALGLAKRRGHAQVTPLHVAATLLCSTTISTNNLLRMACIKSHHPNSHPLPCRALELCLGIALNRLPSMSPPPFGSLFSLHGPNPSLSNALIAALKRAHAHQRKGCIEQLQKQQQLDIKVELEQLIISILDDPGVSRVMREAGFSSTCIKKSMEVDSSSPTSSPSVPQESNRGGRLCQTNHRSPSLASSQREDLEAVVDALVGKKSRSNTVVLVGDTSSHTEGLVSELMRKVDKGEVPKELRSVLFIDFPLSASHLRFMSSTDVCAELTGLSSRVSSLVSEGRGIIVYLGDLKWVVEEEGRVVDNVIEEVGRLQAEWWCHGSNRRLWLMATASYQTYMRCQMRKPSLEAHWSLNAVTVPSGGLALSLHEHHRCHQIRRVHMTSETPMHLSEPKPFSLGYECDGLNCCAECTSNFKKEAAIFNSVPSEDRYYQEDSLVAPRGKWNGLCQSLLNRNRKTHTYLPSFNQSLAYPCDSLDPISRKSSTLVGSISVPFRDLLENKHVNQNEDSQEEGSREYLSKASSGLGRKASYKCVSTNLALGLTEIDQEGEDADLATELKLEPTETGASEDHRKRRAELAEPPKRAKKPRQAGDGFDLNISTEDQMDEEEHPSSILTQESNVVGSQ